MPIQQIIWIQEQVPLFIWKTEQAEEPVSVGHAPTTTPRQREQAEGKALLAYACQTLQLPFEHLTKDVYGKPQLLHSDWEFSITHSSHYLAVVFHPKAAIGIDLERPQAKIGKVISRICSPEELAWAGQDAEKQCFLWSAKEAMYKLYGKREVDFRKHLLVYSETKGEIRMPQYSAEITFVPFWHLIPNYIVVVALLG